MPVPNHRKEAQKALDSIWGIKAGGAKLAQTFGYDSRTSNSEVKRFVLKKRKTTQKAEELNQVLGEVGLGAHRNRNLDIKTAKKFVAHAKQIFGHRPQLITTLQIADLLKISGSQAYSITRSRIFTKVYLRYKSMRPIPYFDRKTLAQELKSQGDADFLMEQTKSKSPQTKKRIQTFVEKIQQNANRLLKQ